MHDVSPTPSPPRGETPDIRRTPFGFVALESGSNGRQRHRAESTFRLRTGGWVLSSAAPSIAARLHPSLARTTNHGIARLWAKAVVRTLDIDLVLDGWDHIDTSRQYVVMPLHESFVDIPALLHLPLDLRFTAREELFSVPRIGPYAAATNQILVPDALTVGTQRSFYAAVAAAVDEGDSIVVFPQGSVLGVEVAFKQGVARIAKRFELPVLPVVLSGTHRVWEYPFTQVVRFGQRVAMSVLPPIDPSHVSIETIRQTEREMKRNALASADAPVRRFLPERDGWWDTYDFSIDTDFPELSARFAARS